ncbi:MAG TPA: hypothetical protein PKE69_10340 [Pyrinomonadaceae bacterium]|nr:hypothetical protein [Pyrinomonadaceae bacterium]
MAIGISMAIARKNDSPDSNITYTYDNCNIEQIGLNGRSSAEGAFGIGLMMQRIIDDAKLDFVKIIDPIITHRLHRAFFQRKKFRKLDLIIQEGTMAYNIRFEEVNIVSLKQQLEGSIIKDIVAIQAKSAEMR